MPSDGNITKRIGTMFGNTKYRLILGSQSPRRRKLLKGLELDFEVRLLKEETDESYPQELRGADIPLYVARKKAAAYMPDLKQDELLITADTVVCLDGKTIGKPHDREEAINMLSMLSGHTHEVHTGVCLTSLDEQSSFTASSDVTFSVLEEDEIAYYVDKFHPYDKAGAYGIQEWIGYVGVESISGSFYNVMGLPVQRLYRELKKYLA
jgi:septum formation protein